MHRLAGKTAIVTGAGLRGGSGGTGCAAAVRFAEEGARVCVVDIELGSGKRTVERIESLGGEAFAQEADITDAQACQAVVAAVVEQWGRLDVLDNNVGLGMRGTVVEVSEADWDRAMAVNVKGIFLMSKYAVPAMVDTGAGSIINISSINPRRPYNTTPYAAAKAAVEALTRGMAVDHGPQNIRVNCIAPGPLATARDNHLDPRMREMRRLASPLQREGRAVDVADAAVFLASDESAYITGEVITVDGGVSLTGPRYR
ncbi:SDR family oxidoreductase [Kribbella sp. NBC_00709]|uniref:SDR family NAD(P)-dependent oxidoreductase n=1 Tax=Kribbella sp. NBC_00709 TaxID=2975972 RepID=UPI002E2C36D6|nr:SDR family oxidoreductase [Kribbella sp. NBC_00709]